MFKYLNKDGIYVCEDLHTSLVGGHYRNTIISALDALKAFETTKKINSEVINLENTDYLNNNTKNVELFYRSVNSLKCARCGKINFNNVKICECKEILSPNKQSITSIIQHY
jgi:hypothetical protein